MKVIINITAYIFIITVIAADSLVAFADSPDISRQKELAENGVASAQYEVGIFYLTGSEEDRDYNEAFYWLQMAADQCYVPAYCQLAYTYYKLQPIGWSEKHRNWLIRAVEANDPQGTYEYAFMADNKETQFNLWLKAAILGYEPAYARAGDGYYYGIGTSVDYRKAIKWYRQAVALRDTDPNLCCNLARCYLRGYDDEESLAKAYDILLEGARRDMTDTTGYILLGNYYEYGSGGALLDLDESLKWYVKAQSTEDIERIKIKSSELIRHIDKPIIQWHTGDSITDQRKYDFTVAVTSDTPLEELRIYINNSQDRGYCPVSEDADGTMTLRQTISLHQGKNDLRVKVKNAGGWSELSHVVYYTPSDTQGNRRIALLIGNGEYQYSEACLTNPIHDVNDIAEKLQELDFKVRLYPNLDKANMEQRIDDFMFEARDYDIVFLYYAGHGINSEGINYLMPVDANMRDESEIKNKCYALTNILNRVNSSKMNIIVLDACRNNPITQSWHRGMNQDGGLVYDANMPKGIFISFSTASGDQASDGINGKLNSPYATAFIETLDKPNVPLTEVFRLVGERVKEDTHGRQNPCYYSGFSGQFFFNPQ